MPWSTSNRILQNAAQFFIRPGWEKAELILKELKACYRSSLGPLLETARGRFFFWPFHPLPLVVGVTIIQNTNSPTIDIARGIRGGDIYIFT